MVHTKPRAEARAFENLERQGFEVFLPMITLQKVRRAKLANVSVPLLLKELVDAMSLKPGDPQAVLVVPVALLVGYGALRLMTSAFSELRELVFALSLIHI